VCISTNVCDYTDKKRPYWRAASIGSRSISLSLKEQTKLASKIESDGIMSAESEDNNLPDSSNNRHWEGQHSLQKLLQSDNSHLQRHNQSTKKFAKHR
jgi:hypothetical protein